jgi:hypothetical protein
MTRATRLRCTTDAGPAGRLHIGGMDTRYVCEACGTKWFVRGGRGVAVEASGCRACGGTLRPLESEDATSEEEQPEPRR